MLFILNIHGYQYVLNNFKNGETHLHAILLLLAGLAALGFLLPLIIGFSH